MCGRQWGSLLKIDDRSDATASCPSLIKYISKESNGLEDVVAGLVHSEKEVYTEYTDTRRDEWETITRPRLKELSLAELQKKTGLSRRTLMKARAGETRPNRKNQELLTTIVRESGGFTEA